MHCAPLSLRLLTAALALLGACSFLTGCASEPKDESTLFERLQGQETKREEERRKRDQERARREGEAFADTLPDYRPAAAGAPRVAIRVTWEALARERELFENSQYRRPQGGLAPEMIVTLVNASHPDADRIRFPRTESDRERFARTAVVPDEDMLALVRGLQKNGFDRLAQPTDMQRGQWTSDSARGRVTIEEGPQSLTLLSMRGQGQNPATKDIPALYSEAKRAVMLVRNQNASLNVTSVERGDAFVPLGR